MVNVIPVESSPRGTNGASFQEYLLRRQRKTVLEKCRRIAVLGASSDPNSKSYLSIEKLLAVGLEIIPIIRGCKQYLGVPCYESLRSVTGKIDVVQLYPSEEIDVAELATRTIEKGATVFWVEEGWIDPEVKEMLARAKVQVVELESLEKEYLKHFPFSSPPESSVPFEKGPVRVASRMTANPVTVRLSDSIGDAIDKMREGGFRHLPVVDDEGKLIAMLSDRDIRLIRPSLAYVPFEEAAIQLSSTAVLQAAVFDTVTIHPDALLERAAELMLRWRVGGLPVVGDEGTLVGIITYTDLLQEFVGKEQHRR